MSTDDLSLPQAQNQALVTAALAYAQKGAPVFPCRADKSPWTEHGFQDATTDAEQIARWWKSWPDALIGVPTGRMFAVLDLDVKSGKNGLAQVPDWAERSPVIARTKSGGAHLYFAPDDAPHCTADQLALGVDTRGLGGYVIVPPSKGYTWTNGSLLDHLDRLPPWPDDLRLPSRDHHVSGEQAQADLALIAAAAAVIPPADHDRDRRVKIGMSIHSGTNGSEEGFDIWWEWLVRGGATHKRKAVRHWRGFRPHSIGIGTLFHEAREADSQWRDPFDHADFEKINAVNEAFSGITSEELYKLLGVEPSPTVVVQGGLAPPCGGGQQAPTKNEMTSPIVMVRASDIVPRVKSWLWKGHLLRGALELLTGLPGLGKSQVQCNFVACVTARLKWPDGAPPMDEPMNVIMVTAEDALDTEVVPRLIAAGANLERVHILKAIRTDKKQRQFLLAEDLVALERAAAAIGNVGLITIDPITAYMGGKMDSHKATEVRSQLGPLKDFAERSNTAVSAITHPAKNASARAIDHFIGSQAFIAAARLGHVCTEEIGQGEDEEKKATGRTLFTHAKHNAHVRMPTLAYRIGELAVGQDQQTGETICAPRVIWEQEAVNVSADEALAAGRQAGRSRGGGDTQTKVQAFLREMLGDGNPVEESIIKDYGAQRGFSPKQLRTAKEKLGVQSEKTGPNGGWVWHLPF